MSVHHYERVQGGYRCRKCKDTLPLTDHDAVSDRKRRVEFVKAQAKKDAADRRGSK